MVRRHRRRVHRRAPRRSCLVRRSSPRSSSWCRLAVGAPPRVGRRRAGGGLHRRRCAGAVIVDHFRPPPTPYGAGQPGPRRAHRARARRCVASAAGEVVFAGAVAGTLHVTVLHADGLRTSYSFLAAVLGAASATRSTQGAVDRPRRRPSSTSACATRRAPTSIPRRCSAAAARRPPRRPVPTRAAAPARPPTMRRGALGLARCSALRRGRRRARLDPRRRSATRRVGRRPRASAGAARGRGRALATSRRRTARRPPSRVPAARPAAASPSSSAAWARRSDRAAVDRGRRRPRSATTRPTSCASPTGAAASPTAGAAAVPLAAVAATSSYGPADTDGRPATTSADRLLDAARRRRAGRARGADRRHRPLPGRRGRPPGPRSGGRRRRPAPRPRRVGTVVTLGTPAPGRRPGHGGWPPSGPIRPRARARSAGSGPSRRRPRPHRRRRSASSRETSSVVGELRPPGARPACTCVSIGASGDLIVPDVRTVVAGRRPRHRPPRRARTPTTGCPADPATTREIGLAVAGAAPDLRRPGPGG